MTETKKQYLYTDAPQDCIKKNGNTAKIWHNGFWHSLEIAEINIAIDITTEWLEKLYIARGLMNANKNCYLVDEYFSTSYDNYDID